MRRTRQTVRTLAVGDLTLTVVERDHAEGHQTRRGCWFRGGKELVAVVVAGDRGVRAFDAAGIERTPAELRAAVPDLAGIV